MDNMLQYKALQDANGGWWVDPDGIIHGDKITWDPIPENFSQKKIIPRSQILHTNSSKGPATWQNIRGAIQLPGMNTESHIDVDNSGAAGQFLSIYVQGDCNYSANGWEYQGRRYGAISIETGDMGQATVETTQWNFAQLDTLIKILTAVAVTAGTGCNEVLAWDGKGIDYHTKFPYHGPGIPAWTNVPGKTCPGKAKKLQVPWIRQAVADKVAAYINNCAEYGVPHGIPGL